MVRAGWWDPMAASRGSSSSDRHRLAFGNARAVGVAAERGAASLPSGANHRALPAHAIGWLARESGRAVPAGSTVLVTLSGRGDKDVAQVAEMLTGERL